MFDDNSDEQHKCMDSNGYWFVLLLNLAIIPAILQPTLQKLSYFTAVSVFLMMAAFTGFINEIRFMDAQSEDVKVHEYGMDPVTVNIDISYVKWSGMLAYITIYSALFENTACIIHLYSEYDTPKTFI